ncbi:endoglucanase [Humitalea rosea]|uniref:cellulase n=2 Tax=Humitalea rosea TaxID=990373 RepID=A0A2W7KBD8_9PROT|nr:endoglucanase [Humitalea rosea]
MSQWDIFKTRFLARDGRVIDTGNGGVSHSEGQGWALLLAQRAGDREAFDRILRWTRQTLRRPGDALYGWRFRPGAGVDANSATDGDLFISAALVLAGERWGEPHLVTSGAETARDILRLLLRRAGSLTLLLPGVEGFERADRIIVNPSYYAFPAIRVLARAFPDPAWMRVAADGLTLLRAARFGRWGLPPDWLSVARADASLALPRRWAPRFSYDAVRIPLYLTWAGLADEPARLAAAAFWGDAGNEHLPAWTDLTSDAISPYRAADGVAAVARLTLLPQVAPIPDVAAAQDYYGAVLGLLTQCAWRDTVATPL